MEQDSPPGAAAVRLEEDTEEEVSVVEVEVEDMANEEDLGKRLRKLLEKEKKRVTVGFVSEIEDIRRGYESVIGGLRLEVASLKGSLKENRKCFKKLAGAKKEVETEGRNEEHIAEQVVKLLRERERIEKEKEVSEHSVRESEREATASEETTREEGKKVREKKTKEGKKKKTKEARGEAQGAASTSGVSARSFSEAVRKGTKSTKEVKTTGVTEARDEDKTEAARGGKKVGFTEVNRKSRNNKGEDKRKENWRAKEPTKTFVVEVGKGNRDQVKKGLWTEMVKKVRAPRVAGVSVLARGDLRVTPGDADTLAALRTLEKEGKIGVREVGQNWPKILIYDVEQEMEAGEIGRAVRSQNEETGIEEGREELDLKPLFKKGPKGGESTWWVCEVNPKVYGKLVNRRVFIGMSSCKVIEFVDVYQCKGCLGFGHMEAKCLRKRIICSHCAKEGHRITECKDREGQPKCFNCGERKEAGHRDCRVRKSVTRATMVRTDYGSK